MSGGTVLSNVDLNDYKTNGAWLISDTHTITNAPVSSMTSTYGTLYVRKNGNYITQIFITLNGSAIRQSYNSGTTWGIWTAYGSRPLQSGLAIVANGDTHAAITKGQYVYIKNHASLAEGLYTANDNIETNGALYGNVYFADSSGELNVLSERIADLNSIMNVEILPNPAVLISEASLNNFQVIKYANIVFFRGNIDFPNTQISAYTNILDFGITVYSMGVGALDVTDNTVTLCGIINANGRLQFTKYIPAEHRIYIYGSAILR